MHSRQEALLGEYLSKCYFEKLSQKDISMGKREKSVDEYISKSKDFAKPILKHIRGLVHKGCPGVEEKMKWSFPTFNYKGSILCNMAAFKQHATFGFWKVSLLRSKGVLPEADESAMGQFGKITKISDLPSDKVILTIIKEAVKLTDAGIKISRKKKAEKKELVVPDYFAKALDKNKKAKKNFDNFSPSHKREYIEWITEAKTEETRNKRINTSIEWMSEGKPRNWKYMKKNKYTIR
jgi:uncharacterized protein YdeI (YjbR/CyaY-like superfamily)